jgi:hypothetical protein
MVSPGRIAACMCIAACVLGGCAQAHVQPATEVLVVVSSDLEIGTQLNRLHVQVKNKAGDSASTSDERNLALVPQASKEAKATGPYKLPLSFSVVPPKNGDDSRFRIVVTGLLGDQEVVEQQEIVTFQPGKTTLLPVFLSVNCFERLCRDEQSTGKDFVCEALKGLCDAVPISANLVMVDPKMSPDQLVHLTSVSPPTLAVDAAVQTRLDGDAGGGGSGGAGGGVPGQGSPVTLVSMRGAGRITTDGINVYWTNPIESAVYMCPVSGCDNKPMVLATGQAGAHDIAVHEQSVYWTNSSSVMTCGIAGCTNSPSPLASCQPSPSDIIAHGNILAWTCGNLWGCTLPNCSNRGFIGAIAGDSGALSGLALDDSNVYWIGYSRDTVIGTPLSLLATRNVLASDQKNITAISTDGRDVYWTTSGDGTVASCPVSGCPDGPKILATGQDDPIDIAVDGVNVYWINWRGGQVMGCLAATCASTIRTIAMGQNNPSGIAIDEANIYWTHDGHRCKQLISGPGGRVSRKRWTCRVRVE